MKASDVNLYVSTIYAGLGEIRVSGRFMLVSVNQQGG